ncbi:hypothetical protein V6Z11_D07G081500 [Gossypium hirsutum]
MTKMSSPFTRPKMSINPNLIQPTSPKYKTKSERTLAAAFLPALAPQQPFPRTNAQQPRMSCTSPSHNSRTLIQYLPAAKSRTTNSKRQQKLRQKGGRFRELFFFIFLAI